MTKVIVRLSQWWRKRDPQEEQNGDSAAFVTSLLCHLVLLLSLGFIPYNVLRNTVALNLTTKEVEEDEELQVPEEFFKSEIEEEQIGANSYQDTKAAMSRAPVVADFSDVPHPSKLTDIEISKIRINETIDKAVGLHLDKRMAVKGAAGEGVTGVRGAIDRITQEILLSLEERKTLVVWLFDQSGSLLQRRSKIEKRFRHIYDELGVIEASGHKAFKRHTDKPLLTSVMAFGSTVSFRTRKPTDNVGEIRKTVREIPMDGTGVELAFTAINLAANKYSIHRAPGINRRNVMLIVVTDERGEDRGMVDKTIRFCRKREMPVYVIGVPAPFGRAETVVKWIDPDPKFDQSVKWGRVDQGPESLFPERIRLAFAANTKDIPIDSGFGPHALTRLCFETGGIYFAVHPNRNIHRSVNRRATKAYASHMQYFFDPDVMRRYKPDYISQREYLRRARKNKARWQLLKAAQLSWLKPMAEPAVRFEKRNEATFSAALSTAQRKAAVIEPMILTMFQTLRLGEADRLKETSPRWQAGYDLAMGRVMAVMVRTTAYNAMLAKAKRGIKFKNRKNNVWTLEPANNVSVNSQLDKAAQKANAYLKRVIKDHAGTPWALLAKRELKEPVGWKWTESYVAPPKPRPRRAGGGGGGVPRPAVNERARMLRKRKPTRPLPKL